MKRAVSTILIPMLLVSQGICSAPHSHAGTSIVEPEGHAARPHVHGADHHERHHDDHHRGGDEPESSQEDCVPEHDSDAVYFGDHRLANDGKVVRVGDVESIVSYLTYDDLTATTPRPSYGEHQLSPVVLHLKCPTYLQLLSLRC